MGHASSDPATPRETLAPASRPTVSLHSAAVGEFADGSEGSAIMAAVSLRMRMFALFVGWLAAAIARAEAYGVGDVHLGCTVHRASAPPHFPHVEVDLSPNLPPPSDELPPGIASNQVMMLDEPVRRRWHDPTPTWRNAALLDLCARGELPGCRDIAAPKPPEPSHVHGSERLEAVPVPNTPITPQPGHIETTGYSPGTE